MGGLGAHAICNGILIDAGSAVLPVQNREVQNGFGVYESLRVKQGQVVYLEDHLRRLFNSAQGIGLAHEFTAVQIGAWIDMLIASDMIVDATVRIQLMGGPEPLLFIIASTILAYPDAWYVQGVRATTWVGERLFPRYKTCSLLLNYLALRSAQQQKAFEALLVDHKGRVLEGTRSNFFAFEDNTIHTAGDELVLEGVTRDKIIKAIGILGFQLVFEAPTLDDLRSGRYSELFISSTSMGAMPLSMLDGMGCGTDFSKTRSIHALIRKWEAEALH